MVLNQVVIVISGAHKAHALQKCVEEGLNHMWTVSMVQVCAARLLHGVLLCCGTCACTFCRFLELIHGSWCCSDASSSMHRVRRRCNVGPESAHSEVLQVASQRPQQNARYESLVWFLPWGACSYWLCLISCCWFFSHKRARVHRLPFFSLAMSFTLGEGSTNLVGFLGNQRVPTRKRSSSAVTTPAAGPDPEDGPSDAKK